MADKGENGITPDLPSRKLGLCWLTDYKQWAVSGPFPAAYDPQVKSGFYILGGREVNEKSDILRNYSIRKVFLNAAALIYLHTSINCFWPCDSSRLEYLW